MARYHTIINAQTGEVREVPYTPEEEAAADAADLAAAALAPDRVNNSQMRAALVMGGYLDAINAFIDSLPEPQRSVAKVGWEYGNEIYRISPLVQAAQAALGLTDQQVDDLFRLAATIEF